MTIDDLRMYQEMQSNRTLEKFAQREYEAQQSLLRQANPMREFERRAALLGYGQGQGTVVSQGVVMIAQAIAYRSGRT